MTTPDMTHECPGPACRRRVNREMLACLPHWRQVDKDAQALVWHTYRHGTVSEHAAAMRAAIAQMRRIG